MRSKSSESTTLCVIVANADQEVIPGSGNCGKVPAVDDSDVFLAMADRIEGQWVGRCINDRATAILPDEWRWFSFSEFSAAELAAEIRPTDQAETAEIFEEVIADGGVVWAEGPVVDGFITNVSMSIIPGDFGLNDSPQITAPTDHADRRSERDLVAYPIGTTVSNHDD